MRRGVDLLERVRADSTLDELPAYKALVDFFGAVELMRWPSVEKLYVCLCIHIGVLWFNLNWSVYSLFLSLSRSRALHRYKDELASMDGFGKDGKLWGVLHQRVVEVCTYVCVPCLSLLILILFYLFRSTTFALLPNTTVVLS